MRSNPTEFHIPTEVPMEPTTPFEVLSGQEYYPALATSINDAKKKDFVSLSTMALDIKDPNVKPVIHSLIKAAGRGAYTALAIDNFNFMDKHPILPFGESVIAPVTIQDYNDPLLKSGYYNNGSTMFIGATNFPSGIIGSTYHGRSHIKAAAVGDKLFVGGASLDATDRLDAVAVVENPDLAYEVSRFIRRSIIQKSVKDVLHGSDKSIKFAPDSHLMIDAGVRGQSAILEEALDIIDSANDERLVYASEQFPTGKIGRHLLDAYERGVDVVIGSNHPSHHDRFKSVHNMILAKEKRSKPASFFAHQVPSDGPVLHTKIVASESRALIGSHNLNSIGVRLGTAEMDIATSNPSFVKAVADLALRQIQFND